VSLLGLLDIAGELPGYHAIEQALVKDGTPVSATLLDGAKPFLLAALWRRSRRPMLVVVSRPEAARQLHEQLLGYLGETAPALLLPEPDAFHYERLASERVTIHQRLRAFSALTGVTGDRAPLVVASAYAVAVKTVAPGVLRPAAQRIKRGAKADLMTLMRSWAAAGYMTESVVETPGSMSKRGGIVDIYPPTSPHPVRLDFFGDVIESIRYFDPLTQRSEGDLQEMVIAPATEVLAPPGWHPPALATGALNATAAGRFAEDLRRLAEREPFDESEFYRSLVNGDSALAYAGSDAILIADNPPRLKEALEEIEAQAKELRERLTGDGDLPKDFPSPFLTGEEFLAKTQLLPRRLTLEPFAEGAASLPFAHAPAYAGRSRAMVQELAGMARKGERIVLASQQAPRLAELLQEAGVATAPGLDASPPKGVVSIVHTGLAEGWALPEFHVTLLTDAEVFGLAKQRRYIRKRPVQRQSIMTDLAVGDYVVHIDYGIGKFIGTTVRKTDDREREYLTIEYAASDRLLTPTDQLNRISPYIGASDRPPSLTRLGTQEWTRLKERVRESAAKVAKELLALYAAREIVQGHAFSPDAPWQKEMEAAFPYVETPDQMKAIIDVKADMEKTKPMDRIITGDVGYGKTEVAIRAGFKAVMDGMQVAILVPTTVLALQHFETFRQRMAAFPTRIEMLSRFVSDKHQREVVEALAVGKVDIVIGTHRLLQKDVQFKNLGLVVIDEEQRFGVAHKERLKELRREVDVLSMSATPIPRTLYMALAGVRDMSVMETPPEERQPIKTYVAQFDERLVRDAILREMERGGQVFFVHNRVYNISAVADRLQRLVPEARILIGHGQMPEELLEKVMLDFLQEKADVLVCTTIIESGLDMPNVNTLIVNDADRMGLSQLHQLRGRVGRSANRAYAYFLYKPERQLTETAEKRLRTIMTATELGAGFKIALKDLEIRGAGNLLGLEQHGQISSVGFDLYVRLLGEAVEELKLAQAGQPVKREAAPPAPMIDLPVAAHIPESYIGDMGTRLTVYTRMAHLKEATEVDDIAEEMKDRFGPWPESVENLLFMLKVKLLAQKANVLSVSTETGELVLTGDEKTWANLLGVQRPYGDGVRIGHTRVRLDINKLGKRWRAVLTALLTQARAKEKVEAE
jgi:transcription-repair coupling factor (superfamily II helicase)